jgi:hypothetical protein
MEFQNFIRGVVFAAGATMGLSAHAAAVTSADIVFIVDESGSMSGEHSFLSSVITTLDSALAAAGVTTVNYGVVGFGSAAVAPHQVGPNPGLNNVTDTQTNLGSLVINGSTEDGWAGINYALNNFAFTGQAKNFILVTDEDRDNTNGALSYAGILADMKAAGVVLNSVVNAQLRDASSAVALGVNDTGESYVPDGFGGFVKAGGGTAISGYGTTLTDYVDLAWATGGAAWDLNQLRAGGLLADSFGAAFVDIKVQEIITPPGPSPVPLPMPALMLLTGLGGLGGARMFGRRKAA